MVNTLSVAEPEDLIPDRYQIERFLGSGGYGQVYSAFDSVLLRNVAIKIIKYQGAKALTEAQALASCNSPNIVEVYDVIHDDHHVAIVMEMVESPVELDSSSICLMDKATFLDLYSQVLKAVAAIHKAGLLHLDLKPSNILYTPEGDVKVSDFGLSTRQKAYQESSNHSHSGSWECLSPEHLLQQPLSEFTDVFALGIFLYTYLFKHHPFVAEGDISTTQNNIRDVNFQFGGRPVQSLPELEPLVLAMLNRNPKRRPTVNQVMSAVENLRRNDGVPSETVDLPAPTVNPKRKKIIIASAASIVVTAIVLLVPLFKPVSTTLVLPPLKSALPFDGDAESRKEFLMLAAIVEDEIVSSVIDDPRRRLVSKKEWRGTTDWIKEAEQVDVDEIIISDLGCDFDFCDVSLSIFNRKKGDVSDFVTKSIPTSDLLIFSQVIEQTLISELGFPAREMSVVSDISDADLRLYYQYKKQLEAEEFTEEHISELQKLSTENPGFLGAQILLGNAYRNLYKNNNVDRWLNESQELALTLRKQFPDNASVLYMDFRNKMLAKDHVAARNILQQLKRIVGVETTQLVLSEAKLIFAMDREKGYQKLLEYKNPRLTQSYYHYKAYMEEILKKFDALEKTCYEWVGRFPDSYLPNFFLANSYLTTGRLKEAERLYAKILDEKSDHDIILNLGIVQLLLGEFSASIKNFRKALEFSPDSSQIYLNLAEAYKAVGDKQSHEYFVKTLSLYDTASSEQDFAHKALVLAHLGRDDEAIIELQRAAQLDNKAGEFFFIAAQVHQLLGQEQAALFNAREAIKAGFGLHWFRLPWTQSLYDLLDKSTG